MKEGQPLIGEMIRLGKGKKGKIIKHTDEQEVEKGIKKLAHFTAEVENPWGIDEVEIPDVAIEIKEEK